MARPAPVSDLERRRIEKALRNGESVHATAKASGRGKATVHRIAHAAGIDTERSGTKRAAAARRDYAQAERLTVLNETFDQARRYFVRGDLSAQGFQQVMVGLGIAIDKRRLEEGEATARTETSTTEARAKVMARIDELVARRTSGA